MKCFQILNSNKKKDIHDVVMCLCIQNIIPLFLLFKNKYSEIVVWNCYAEWNEFVKDQQTTDDFLTIKKTNFETNLNPSFYLKFNPYDKNSVEIIYDLLFDNCRLINKEDLIKILIG